MLGLGKRGIVSMINIEILAHTFFFEIYITQSMWEMGFSQKNLHE